MHDFASARANMIDGQIRPNKVADPRLIDAMATIGREAFVAEGVQGVAYGDGSAMAGNGRMLMAPMVLARMIEAAVIGPADAVLDIAGATGYSAAVLSRLAGRVVAVEPDPALARTATERLAAGGFGNVDVVNAPAEEGCADRGPYDVILVNGAVERIPVAFIDQLTEGGRLVAVEIDEDGVGRVRLHLKSGGAVASRILFEAASVRAPGFRRAGTFVF